MTISASDSFKKKQSCDRLLVHRTAAESGCEKFDKCLSGMQHLDPDMQHASLLPDASLRSDLMISPILVTEQLSSRNDTTVLV